MFIVFFIQFTITLLLVAYSLLQIIKLVNGLEQVESLKDAKAYIASDSTQDAKVREINSRESRLESIEKLKEFYFYLSNLDEIEQYTIFGYDIGYNSLGILETQKTANKKFFDMFKFKVIEGRLFNNDDFIVDSEETVPVLIGYNLKECYNIGDTYTFSNGGTGKEFKGKVIGILQYNSSYPDIYNIYNKIVLNDTYIIPLNLDYMMENSGVSDFDMAINSTVLFSTNAQIIKNIENVYKSYNLFNVKFIPIQESLNEFIEYMKPQIIYELVIAFIIIIFAAIGMISSMILIVNRNMKEYTIHILCGAQIGDIIKRIVLQILLLLVLAIIPILLLFNNLQTIVYTLIFDICIGAVILIPPIYKLESLKIIDMIRRYE